MNWTYKQNEDFEIPKDAIGFIYILKYDNKTKAYIGKKSIDSRKTLPALKSGEIRPGAVRVGKLVFRDLDGNIIVSKKDKQRARKDGLKAKREYFDVMHSESSWRSYESSSDDVKNHTLSSKEILQWAFSKKELTYLENKWLFSEAVLERHEYLNSNIAGVFFAGELKNKVK